MLRTMRPLSQPRKILSLARTRAERLSSPIWARLPRWLPVFPVTGTGAPFNRLRLMSYHRIDIFPLGSRILVSGSGNGILRHISLLISPLFHLVIFFMALISFLICDHRYGVSIGVSGYKHRVCSFFLDFLLFRYCPFQGTGSLQWPCFDALHVTF